MASEDAGGGSRELDVGRALVAGARRVVEGDGETAGVSRLEGEGEEGILAHALRGVEGRYRLALVGGLDPVDVAVLLRDDLALSVALDALHGMNPQRPH